MAIFKKQKQLKCQSEAIIVLWILKIHTPISTPFILCHTEENLKR